MAKFIGKGSTIDFTYNSTQSTVTQLLGITPAASAFGEVEATTLDSTRREFLPTILEDGVAAFRVALDNDAADHGSAFSAFQAGATMSIVIRLATSALNNRIVKMAGFFTGFSIDELVVDDLIRATVGFRSTSITAPASST